ncbi:MAG: ABC transporter ATP-binding protein, partial [Chlamydiia bacterium]|nr:ABC transporter ATP-binding protein [Chlamydiia bacterium]
MSKDQRLRKTFISIWKLVYLAPFSACIAFAMTVCTYLVEGVGIGLLIPLLDTSPDHNAFSDVPLLHAYASFFVQLDITNRVQLVALGMLLIALIRGAFVFGRTVSRRHFEITLMGRLEAMAYEKYQRLCLDYINKKDLATFVNMITSFPPNCAVLAGSVVIAMAAVCCVLLYGAFIFSISWQVSVCAIALIGLMFVAINAMTANRLKRTGECVDRTSVEMNQWAIETARAQPVIRGMGREEVAEHKFNELLGRYMEHAKREAVWRGIVEPSLTTGIMAILAILLYALSLSGTSAETFIPQALLFIMVLSRCLPIASQLNEARGTLTARSYMMSVLLDFLSAEEMPQAPTGVQGLEHFDGCLTFKSVTFWYPDRDRPALDNVSFSVPAHQMTAIVGPSGSGKSTLIKLILRLHDPLSGKIYADDACIEDLLPAAWRSHIAYVPQEPTLFNRSIRDNLLFASPGASEEDIEEACRTAYAKEFIDGLPQGYDTVIGENGVQLSGGQKQRLAIARALIRKPKLLIMDEATSNLDSQSEKFIL